MLGHGAMRYTSGEGASAPPSSQSEVSPSPVDHEQPQVEGPKGFPTVTFKSLSILSTLFHFTPVSTANWHLPRTLPAIEQQEHLPSAFVEIKTCAAVAIDLQHALKEFRVE